MPIRAERSGVADAAKAVADHATALAKLELRLAGLELKQKASSMGIGAGLLAGAALFGWIAVLLGVAAAVAAISLELPVWASILIVLGGVLLLASVLGMVGLGLLRRGSPPVPEAALEEARLTADALRSGNGRR